MLVDDDIDDRYLIRSALIENDSAIRLAEFASAEDAWKKLNENLNILPDLIVLDLNMPIVDGFEFLKRIRSSEKFNLIPCIVYTTSTDENDLVKSYERGANSFIVKPLSYQDIQTVFINVCNYWLRTTTLPTHNSRMISSNREREYDNRKVK